MKDVEPLEPYSRVSIVEYDELRRPVQSTHVYGDACGHVGPNIGWLLSRHVSDKRELLIQTAHAVECALFRTEKPIDGFPMMEEFYAIAQKIIATAKADRRGQ